MKKRLNVFVLISLISILAPLKILATEISPNNLPPVWPNPVMGPLLKGQQPDIDPEDAKEIMDAMYTFIQEKQEEWNKQKTFTVSDMIKIGEEIQAIYPQSIPFPAEGGEFGVGLLNGSPYLSLGIPYATIYIGSFGLFINMGLSATLIPLEFGNVGMPLIIALQIIYNGNLRYWVELYWAPYIAIHPLYMTTHIPSGDSLISFDLGSVSINQFVSGGSQYLNIYVPLDDSYILSSDLQLNDLSSDQIISRFPETIKTMKKLKSVPFPEGVKE
jgi:hypothetical protein